MTKEEYKKEIVRMWDSIRTEYKTECKGANKCLGVECDDCPFGCLDCENPINTFEMIEILEKWSREHPRTYKVSKLEYDILKTYVKCCLGSYSFSEDFSLRSLLKEGYFQGANEKTNIEYYFNHCEVLDK